MVGQIVCIPLMIVVPGAGLERKKRGFTGRCAVLRWEMGWLVGWSVWLRTVGMYIDGGVEAQLPFQTDRARRTLVGCISKEFGC